MRKFKGLRMLQLLLLSVIVNGCSHVTVKDKEACADLGYVGAQCAHTYIEQRRDIPKAQWDQERVGWICMSAEDFSDSEDSIDELCRNTNLCDYQTKQEIEKFKARMSPLKQSAQQMRKAYGLE